MASKKSAEATCGRKQAPPIQYIRSKLPCFELPAYSGERYEIMVPDTLDLQERARLAIHAMTEVADPLADYEIYWRVYFRSKPPMMIHDWDCPLITIKFMESVSLMRIMSGSEQNSQVDRHWMKLALRGLGPDGLFYTPREGRPWAYRYVPYQVNHRESQLLVPFSCGRLLSTMTLFALRDKGSLWRDSVRSLVDGLIKLAINANNFAFFYPTCMDASKKRPSRLSEIPTSAVDQENSRVPLGLVHAYRLLGYKPALTLAKKIINYMRKYFFAEDGTFWQTPHNSKGAHFHAHTHGLLAMQEYASITGDEELMEFVVRSFEWAKRLGFNLRKGEGYEYLDAPGSNLIGYFPEHSNSPEWEGSEICEVADMISVALLLSEAGIGDYWDDADRWIRNMLAEGQLLSTNWIYDVPEGGFINPDIRVGPNSYGCIPSGVGAYDTAEKVPERNLGSFAGWPAANDWYVGNGSGIMHCCTANGSQTLYRIWKRILRYQNGKLRVNLLFNRTSPWADIISYIPYQGRVEVKVKEAVSLTIRIPEWVTPSETRCQVNDRERTITWDGRYAQVGSVKPKDNVLLSFPIHERKDVVHIEKQKFMLIRKGNEVVYISPPGHFCPLYQREHYRDNTPRYKKVSRFVSYEDIEW